jgi:membrane protease YdiL (CAAX protease family)
MFRHERGNRMDDRAPKPADESPESGAPPEVSGHLFRPAKVSFFIGDDGLLRPGWRLVIYTVALVMLAILLSLPVRAFLTAGSQQRPKLSGLLLGEVISLIAAILPALMFARYERRSFGAYGLSRFGAFGKDFWFGALWGVTAISVLLGVMHGIGIFSFGGVVQHGARALKFAAFWAVLFLVVGFFEEFSARGYSQFTLAQGIGFWPAAVLLSVAFGAIHFPQEYALGELWSAVAGVLAVIFIALFWCLTLRRTGALWFAVGMHAAWDWTESFLYSVPDSGTPTPGHLLSSSLHGKPWLTGGPVGPEASVLVFVLIAVMWVVFDRVYPARRAKPGIERPGVALG